MKADLVLSGAMILPVTGAPIPGGAIAIRGEQVIAVGRPHEVEPTLGPHTKRIRLSPAQAVVPGFNDSHQHILGYAERQSRVQLWETTSVAEVLEQIWAEAAARPPGSWIWAVGHDQGRLAERRHPTLAELDSAAPDHPVYISRACTHCALVNSAAMSAAGLTATTPDPPGGRLERADGRLTGVLMESAQKLVRAHIPRTGSDLKAGLRSAAAAYHARGITSIAEAAVGAGDLTQADLLTEAVYNGDLPLRVYLMPRGALAERLLTEGGPLTGAGDAWVRWGPIKILADGTLGAGTAYLTEDYGDEPGNRGWPVISCEQLAEQVGRAHKAGYQVATHAIGDAAVAMVLDAYEQALQRFPRADHRHRIEHVEVVHPGLPERMARLGVVAGVQSCFTYWEVGDISRLGPGLAPWAHPWGALHAAGVVIANGSDNPVLPDFSPLQGLSAAVTRRSRSGESYAPGQALGLQAALWSYTMGGAYASFEERIKGSLEPGKLADIAVLSGDLTTGDPADLVVDMTIIGGRILFER